MLRALRWILLVIVLCPVSGIQAAGHMPPPPAPYPPLTQSWLSAASSAGTEVVQLSPVEDTFIANGGGNAPRTNFGKENFLLVGQYDDVLTELRTLVGYRWNPPEKFLDLDRAVLFFGVGDGTDKDMPVEVYYSSQPFGEDNATWQNRLWWGGGPPAKGVLGPVGYWYGIDVTDFLRKASSYYYMGFSIRSTMLGYHFYKATLSRESDPELAPQLVIRYRVDDMAPLVWFGGLSEWASTMYDHFSVHTLERPWSDQWVNIELQYRLDGGRWLQMNISSRDRISYPPHAGSEMEMRVRAWDRLRNTSDWVYSPPIKLYSYDLHGRLVDHRQRLLPPVDPHIKPEPWWVRLEPETGEFVARLKKTQNLSASPEIDGYGTWHDVPLFRFTSPVTITLPPPDNLAESAEVELSDAWESYRLEDGIQPGTIGRGGSSTKLIAAPGQRAPAFFCSTRFFDISDLNQPTLSFHYWYGSYPAKRPLVVSWRDDEGYLHELGRTVMHPRAGNSWDNPDWNYYWADLTPLRKKRGRLCVAFERAGHNSYALYLDRVSLGSTASDLSLNLSAPSSLPVAEPTSLAFVVQNSSPYTATAQLHVFALPGSEQTLLLPVLDARSSLTVPATVTIPITGTLLLDAVVGKASIDRTPADNRVRRFLFAHPKHLYLPSQLNAQP
ncbi:MAG: DNRLRE domain-containing protein [Chloroflexi bacterium]|nr:MAG: DNRLRE domain-containing protein [Chloroflexota bacterium]